MKNTTTITTPFHSSRPADLDLIGPPATTETEPFAGSHFTSMRIGCLFYPFHNAQGHLSTSESSRTPRQSCLKFKSVRNFMWRARKFSVRRVKKASIVYNRDKHVQKNKRKMERVSSTCVHSPRIIARG